MLINKNTEKQKERNKGYTQVHYPPRDKHVDNSVQSYLVQR